MACDVLTKDVFGLAVVIHCWFQQLTEFMDKRMGLKLSVGTQWIPTFGSNRYQIKIVNKRNQISMCYLNMIDWLFPHRVTFIKGLN